MLVCPLCRLTLSDTETTCPRDGQTGAPARQTDVPAVVRARFAIVQPFAQGASGDLYVADDQQTGRRGVLKLLRLPASVTPAEKARLKRELVKQATLSAPTLSVPLATGDANGVPWLFREWHDGVSLQVKLARGGALAVPEALAVTAQVASALDELHRSGLLHRDLKPGHILLNPQPSGLPRVALIDAGIAARIETGSVFDVMGTPAYCSPEQAKGKLVSFRSDLYALGCVLYEMLSGAPLFRGAPAELLEAHASQPVAPLQVSVPTGIATLLAQLLAKDPRERPFSAQQVRRALEPFLPEDASSRREATQTFEKLGSRSNGAAPAPAVPSSGRSGTLRPPQKTMQGPAAAPAPKADATEELQPVDLEAAEEVLAPHDRRAAGVKTLLGMPAQPAPSADSTDELTPLDLEQAEQITSAASAVAPRVAAEVPPPAARPAAPPWQQSTLTSQEGPSLDYDDLAETIAVDRDRPAQQAAPATQPVAAHAPPTQARVAPAIAPAAAPVMAKKQRNGGMIAIVAGVAVLGFCGLAGIGAAGAIFYWAAAPPETELASAPARPLEPLVAPTPMEPEPFAPPVPPTPLAQVAPSVEPPAPVAPVAPPEPVAEPVRPAPVAEPARPEPAPAPVAREEPSAPPQSGTERPGRTERASRTERNGRPQRATNREPDAPARPPAGEDRFEQARRQALEHYRAGRFAQAAQAYEQATDLNPRHAGSYAGLGASRVAMRQFPQAVRAYERAVALQPNNAAYHAALGQAHLAAGDSGRARQAFSRALSIDPNNGSARQGLQRLGG